MNPLADSFEHRVGRLRLGQGEIRFCKGHIRWRIKTVLLYTRQRREGRVSIRGIDFTNMVGFLVGA